MQLELPHRRRTLISLTPLIDVVFILLVFFMLATNFLDWRELAVNAPARATGNDAATGAILVRLGANGELDVNGRPVTSANLATTLTPFLDRPLPPPVLLQPAPGASLQAIVAVLDRLHQAGADAITLLEQ